MELRTVDDLVDRAARTNTGRTGPGFQDDKHMVNPAELRMLWTAGALDRGVNGRTEGGYLHVGQYSGYRFVGITDQPLPTKW